MRGRHSVREVAGDIKYLKFKYLVMASVSCNFSWGGQWCQTGTWALALCPIGWFVRLNVDPQTCH